MNSPSPYHSWYKKNDHSDERYVNSLCEVEKFFFEHTSLLNKENVNLEPEECRMPLIRKDGKFIPSEYEYCKKHYRAFSKGEKCLRCTTK